MILTYKYPVYPTQAQEQQLMRWFDHLCELQNSARHDRLVGYETEGVFVSRYDQQKKLTTARAKFDDFRAVPQDFQVSILRRVEKAFDAFGRRCAEGAAKKGYPRYKKRVRSLTWCLRKQKRKTGERVRQNPIIETNFRHNRLKVPKLGEVKIRMHRPLQGDPKEVTLVKKASGWYAHIACDIGDTPKVEPTDAVAVDVGTTHYLTTSDGEKVDNPRWYRCAEGLLRKHSKTQSRRKKGSHRWQKAVHAAALHHERTANKRKDFIGKLVYNLYHRKHNNVLVAENLSVSNMVKNKHLSKSISDTSWSQFFEWCGNIVPKETVSISTKWTLRIPRKLARVVVRNCQRNSRWRYARLIASFVENPSLDRDHNAALNILYRAAAALRGERWVATLCETRNNPNKAFGFKNPKQLSLFDGFHTSPHALAGVVDGRSREQPARRNCGAVRYLCQTRNSEKP